MCVGWIDKKNCKPCWRQSSEWQRGEWDWNIRAILIIIFPYRLFQFIIHHSIAYMWMLNSAPSIVTYIYLLIWVHFMMQMDSHHAEPLIVYLIRKKKNRSEIYNINVTARRDNNKSSKICFCFTLCRVGYEEEICRGNRIWLCLCRDFVQKQTHLLNHIITLLWRKQEQKNKWENRQIWWQSSASQ